MVDAHVLVPSRLSPPGDAGEGFNQDLQVYAESTPMLNKLKDDPAITKAVLAERQRCARIAEAKAADYRLGDTSDDDVSAHVADSIARAIRVADHE